MAGKKAVEQRGSASVVCSSVSLDISVCPLSITDTSRSYTLFWFHKLGFHCFRYHLDAGYLQTYISNSELFLNLQTCMPIYQTSRGYLKFNTLKMELIASSMSVIHSLHFIVIFFKIYLFYLFIFGCVGSSLLCVGFLQWRRAGATLCCSTWASHCGGFSCCRARALGARASVVVAHRLSSCGLRALERRLSSCGTRVQLLHGMWDLPRPGL